MNFFEKFINSISHVSNTPKLFGMFHMISIAILFISTIIVCLLLKNCKPKTLKIFTCISWIILILIETCKQLIFTFSNNNGSAVWNYSWNSFPFQLSIMTIYLLPFIIFLKDGKVRDSIFSFLTFFCLITNVANIFYPKNIFTSNITLNILSMLQNGISVLLKVLFAVYNRKKLGIKYFLSGLIVYTCTLAIAITLNFTFPLFIKDDIFNMFYISYKFNPTFLPYPALLIVYLVAMISSAFLLFVAIYALAHLLNKERLKRANKTKLITSTVFVFVEIALLISTLHFSSAITTYLNFACIVIACILPFVFIYPNKNIFLINISLLLTTAAIISFTLLKPVNYLLGMILLVSVQVAFFVYLLIISKSKANIISNIITRLVLTTGLIIAGIIIFPNKINILNMLSIVSFANLFSNLVFSYIAGKKLIGFSVALSLLTICNTIYAVQDITNLYIRFKFVKITFTSYDIAWLLFVISQIILAITLIYSKKSHTIAEASSLAKIDFLDSVKSELSLNTSNTTIINTNTPNIKIKKKNNGKTTTEINVETNNIPVSVKSETKKKTKAKQSDNKSTPAEKNSKNKTSKTAKSQEDIETEKHKEIIKNKIKKFNTFKID